MSSKSTVVDVEMAQQALPANANLEVESELKHGLWLSYTTISLSAAGVISLATGCLKDITGPSDSLLSMLLISLIFCCFISATCLMFFTASVFKPADIGPGHILCVRILVMLSYLILIASLTFTGYILLNYTYGVLAFLPPLAIGIACYAFFRAPEEPSNSEDSRAKLIKSSSKLSSLVFTLTFGGTVGVMTSRLAKSSVRIHTVSLKICVLILISGFVTAAPVMLITSGLLAMLSDHGMISQLRFPVVRSLTVLSLFLLGMVPFQVCAVFLKGFALLAFVPTLLAAAADFIIYSYFRPPLRPANKTERKDASRIGILLTSLAFGGMLALFTISGHDHNVYLMITMFFLFSAFISGMSTLVMGILTEKGSVVFFRILTYLTFGCLAVVYFTLVTSVYNEEEDGR